jgi:spore maturation protein CgeB
VKNRISFRIFAHSWVSDWNHGNAHFLRGLASELVRMGHEVRCYEESDSWSFKNLKSEGYEVVADALESFRESFPSLDVRFYKNDDSFGGFLRRELNGAEVVIIHEWNAPDVVRRILEFKPQFGFRALFHDTHHRAYTNPRELFKIPLREFDGVLAFGEAIRRIYSGSFGVKRVWTFHEAADVARFYPHDTQKDTDVIWIGNWGDEERTRELTEFLIGPATGMKVHSFAVHGVRYPESAREKLSQSGIEYRGYLPNLRAPHAYGRSRVSLHVPRRFYANGLSGVPTIRVFEALAAGAPLVCSPWSDSEGLFRPGEDFVCVPDGESMIRELRFLLKDDAARHQLAINGRQAIVSRHTCAHRAEQLADICSQLEN